MTKKQKTWTIIMIVVGAILAVSALTDLKEAWYLLIMGLGMVVGGAMILNSGKRKAKKKKAASDKRIAEEEANMEGKEKKEIIFKATYGDRYQDKIAALYRKEQKDRTYKPEYDIRPYLSYDGVSTRYSVVVDDDKIGEPPSRCFAELNQVIDIVPYIVDVRYVPSKTEKGTWYDVKVRCTYWV